MKFYPQDWSGDEQLSLCVLATRGFYASCLHLMHKAEPYGHLLLQGRPPSTEDLASHARCKPREVKAALADLIAHEVVSVTPEDVIFSRRMVRDEARRLRNLANGRKALMMGQRAGGATGPPDPSPIRPGPIASGLLSPEDLQTAAGEFSEQYPVIYATVRSGAHYRANPVRDYPNFVQLVSGWSLPRLGQMLEIFLRRTGRDANNTPGTPGQFLNMAPECDRLLKENNR